MMAHALFRLGHILADDSLVERSRLMLMQLSDRVCAYPSAFANWAQLLLRLTHPFHEIAIVGKDAQTLQRVLAKEYLPGTAILFSTLPSSLPLLENKYVENSTLVYVCADKTCKAPVVTTEEAIRIINQW
jgi:hypothetical protein